MRIKQSLADCLGCELLDAESSILDTNSRADITQVDIVFVGDSPEKEELKAGKPFSGKEFKTFKAHFNKYIKNECKWLLTNTVMCLPKPETEEEPSPSVELIDRCKPNCFDIIKTCKPKLIVLMGTKAMKAFGLGEGNITSKRGSLFKWEEFNVLVTLHPKFVNRQRKEYNPLFEEDIKMTLEIINSKEADVAAVQAQSSTNQNLAVGKKGIFKYKIPEKFYTDEFRLVDIQSLNKTSEILYIFRDKDNNKVYHRENDDYYAYQAPSDIDARKVVPYSLLDQIKVAYRDKRNLDSNITYEGDMKLTVKHAIDYYQQNKGEAKKHSSNIMFCDIEIDVGINNQTFPQPKDALYPIDLITSIYQNPAVKICYILDNNTEPIIPIEGVEFKIFKDEKALIQAFIRDFKHYDPDFMAGWNFIGFDMEYIFNRMRKLRISGATMSKFGEFYVDGERYFCNLPGCVVLDQMHLYKMFTFTKMENYKLDYIAQHELKRQKLELPAKFNKMYWEHLNTLIQYNVIDTELLEDLENKLAHINLLNELRIICNSSFDAATSPSNQIDCIVVSYLRGMDLASKNADPHIAKKKYPGAFVLTPEPGIYNTAVDFDFKSLYPSLIQTYNIGLNNFVMRTKDPSVGYDLAYDRDKLDDKINVVLDPMFANAEVTMTKEEILKEIEDKNLIHTINGCFYKNHKDEVSYYSLILKNLLDSRKKYKDLMFEAKQEGNEELRSLYFTKQLVYKVLANTLYGVIANKSFRFFNLGCAAAITLGGQEALKASIIEGNNFMKHLHKGGELTRDVRATKVETYGDEMPERDFDYIVTGDTDSIFCCFEDFDTDKSDEAIREHCDKIQDYLNGEIMKEVVESHNVDFEECELVLKNELIISRGLFLAKKRYAIRVTNNEGVACDDVNYMGIEVKRSDFPSHSKVFLKELLDIILKDEKVTMGKLLKFVGTKEKEFRKLIKEGSKTVARPTSFGKDLKEYKTLTQGVKAMLSFNEISYQAHYTGSRGYLFHVNGIDYDKAPPQVIENYEKNFIRKGKKLQVVAIPDEEPKLPDYYLVNVNANLKFAFTDRYDLMLAPLMKVHQAQVTMTI